MQPFQAKLVTLALLASVLVGMNSTEPTANAKVIVRNKRGRVVRQATSVSLATLINTHGSIQIDDKIFEHWRDFTNVVTGGATPVDPALITVVATGEGTCDPGPGVRIESAQFALTGSAQSQTTMFTYDVRTLTAAPAIDDVTLSVGSANADLAGVIQVTETVQDTNQTIVATLSVQVNGLGTNPPSATDHQVFAAPQSVVTVTKIIHLSNGGPEDTGTASLGEVDQNYSQVCGTALQVTKQIACLPCVAGIGCEDLLPTAYSGTATGLLSDTALPIFCYSITVTNAGVEALQSITLADSSGLNFSGCFTNGFALPVGGSTNCFIAAALSGDTTNTVTVTATGVNSLTPVTASASATAIVLRATINCPGPVTVQCAGDVPPPGTVTATLNCNGPVGASSSDQIIAGDCPNRFTIQRTYTAQDACSNSVSCVQNITVSDTMPPALTGVPDNLTVQCIGDVPLPATVTATDNCDGAITPVPTETQSNPGSSCSNLITRTWTATDSCGNTASLSQHILVNDTTPPVITACPTNLTVCASAGIPPSNISLVTATDNCGGAVTITVLPDVVNGTCPQVVTRTYLATDVCSNQTPCVQTITANCGPACSLAPPNPLPACGSTNNTLSGPGGLATYSWSDTGSSAGWAIIAGNDSQTITYTAGESGLGVFTLVGTDANGCASTCSVSFACGGGVAPSLVVTKQIACLPCGSDVACGGLPLEAYSSSATGYKSDTASPVFCYSITVSNAGTEVLANVAVAEDIGDCFQDPFTLAIGVATNCFVSATLDGDTTNTVTATATGTNSQLHVSSSATATAIVLHATINCPGPVTVQCAGDVPLPGTVTATLNCNGPVAASSSDQIIAGDCPNRFTIQRTYTAQDTCSNSVSCVQIITVSDTMPPALTGVPDDLTVQCLGDVPLPATVTATDNCDGAITPVPTETQSNPGSSCSNLITRTWTATDSCGNTASLSQHILVNDTTPPVITACPTNVTVCASAGIPPSDISLVTATDNCGGPVTITVLPDVVNGTCPQVVTRTYLATDACSNQTPCVQTITANCGPACSLTPPNPLPACGSTNNTLSGPAGLTSYSWSDTGSSAGWAIIAGNDSQTITYTAGESGLGVFTLVGTDANGCASTCSVSFACAIAGTGGCRVTGGSNKQTGSSQQPCITTPPPTFVSHGGQVGAPVGVPTPFTPASVCIRGEWQHTRHLKGNSLAGSFHASGNGQVHQFDSLMCACLPCPGDPGSGGIVGGLCNAGDRICGPEPRSAPANKICFSGVGDYTFSQGQKTVKAVFRVDIEDHGEPGGSSGPRPPDRYRIRLWLLNGTCARSFDAESEPAIALRQAVACANPLTEEVSASAGPPDIDDGGDMTQGNHQIHPETGATCLDEPTQAVKIGKSAPRKGR